MKHTLMVAGTVAALVLGIAQVASAQGLDCDPTDCKTEVSVIVTEGTTLTAPAIVNVGSGFPGQTVDSDPQTVSWWSNEAPKALTVKMDGPLTNPVSSTTILASDVSVSSVDYPTAAAIDVKRPVADIAEVLSATIEDESSSTFNLHIFIPSATEGTYNGFMTWTVE